MNGNFASQAALSDDNHQHPQWTVGARLSAAKLLCQAAFRVMF